MLYNNSRRHSARTATTVVRMPVRMLGVAADVLQPSSEQQNRHSSPTHSSAVFRAEFWFFVSKTQGPLAQTLVICFWFPAINTERKDWNKVALKLSLANVSVQLECFQTAKKNLYAKHQPKTLFYKSLFWKGFLSASKNIIPYFQCFFYKFSQQSSSSLWKDFSRL